MIISRRPGWCFTVPGLPVPKGRPRVVHKDCAGRLLKKPHTYTPKTTKVYEKKVAAMALRAGVRLVKGPVYLAIQVFLPEQTIMDLDNVLKSVLDGLQGIAYENDRQVWAGKFERFTVAKGPQVIVTLAPHFDGETE